MYDPPEIFKFRSMLIYQFKLNLSISEWNSVFNIKSKTKTDHFFGHVINIFNLYFKSVKKGMLQKYILDLRECDEEGNPRIPWACAI